MQQYYYPRDGPPGNPGPGEGPPSFQGFPPGANYGGGQPHMAPPMGILRQQSNPTPGEGYPPMPQQSRSISHGAGMGASPSRGPAQGGPGREAFNVMDTSNFPSLNPNAASSRYGMMGNMGFSAAMVNGGGYGMGGDSVAGGISQQTNFSIQNEDFPALPGSGSGSGVGALHGNQSVPMPGASRGEEPAGGRGGAVRGNVSAAIVGSSRASNSGSQQAPVPPSAGAQQAGSRAAMGGLGGGSTGMQLQQLMNSVESDDSGNPAARSKDTKYGLLGLLDVIKMTDRDLNTLALGTDLTTFGLNLSSADSLYLTFSSPFSDSPAPPEVPYFSTPSCYLMQPPSLKPDHLNKMHMETLFYMFYSMPRDQLQTAAAVELYRREWWFHADLRLWMKMRAQPAEGQPQASPHFVYFDVSSWEAKIYAGNSLRMSGFLPEDDITMALKAQPGAGGASAGPVNNSSAPAAPSNAALNQGSQPVGSAGHPGNMAGSRPVGGGLSR